MANAPENPGRPADEEPPPVGEDERARLQGPKARSVMNGPMYTQRATGRTWETDPPAPKDR